MPDLSIEFCGLKFKNPFLLSSAPPAGNGDMIKRAFDKGWGGAVTKTLGLENVPVINPSPRLSSLSFETFEGESYLYAMENIELISERPLNVWEREISEIVKNYPDRVLISSIMADANKKDEWVELAKRLEGAGAMALELNFSCPHGGMRGESVGSAIGQDPKFTGKITNWVKQNVSIPVFIKLTPNVTDVVSIANSAIENGADGFVAINSVQSIIGVDLDNFSPLPSVRGFSSAGGLSGPAIKPIALRVVSELSRNIKKPLSGVGGIWHWRDAVEFFLLGAQTVQLCTAVMFKGYGIVEDLIDGVGGYLEDKGFSSLREIIGLANKKITSLDDLPRGYQVIPQIDEKICIKCDKCFISCMDGGGGAIMLKEDRLPYINIEKCKGCGLCREVCPVWDCVKMIEIS